MKSKIDYLNYWGESFWPRHLGFFGFIKFFFTHLIDFLEDKMHSPELSILIAGLYLLGLSSSLLGLYQAFGYCEPFFIDYYSVPDFLLFASDISIYSHYFYPLVFVGNLKRAPFFITFVCACFCLYDFVLILVDILFCKEAIGVLVYIPSVIYACFRLFLSSFILFYWVIILFLPRRAVKSLQVISLGGIFANYLLIKLTKFKIFSSFNKIISSPFSFPVRIKAAGFISFATCLLNAIVVTIISNYILELLDQLHTILNEVNSKPGNMIIVFIDLDTQYTISAASAASLLELLISLLTPVYPCFVISTFAGLLVSLLSIFTMFYQYKKSILTIRSEGENSETLLLAWKFSSHNCIFFCPQFIINSLFLNYIFGTSLFLVLYAVSLKQIRQSIFNSLINQPPTFWVGLIPVILGVFYFRFLVNKNNFIKNKEYFSFWDTWYFVNGILGSFFRAATRYFLGIGAALLLGYKVHASIIPPPLDTFDSLYCSFYATIAVQCMKEGIIPAKIKSELELSQSINTEINKTL